MPAVVTGKKQKVYTKTVMDADGNVLENTNLFVQGVSYQLFVKMMFNEIGVLAKCSKAEQSVVLCCTQWLEFDTNEIILTPSRRDDICKCGGLTKNTVNITIAHLYKKNIFIKNKEKKKTYLNPRLFFYGKDFLSGNILTLVNTYKLQKDDSEIDKKEFLAKDL